MQLTYSSLDEYHFLHSDNKPFAYRPPRPGRKDSPTFFDPKAAPYSYGSTRVDSLLRDFDYSDTAAKKISDSLHNQSIWAEQNFKIDPLKQMMRRLRNSVARCARLHCSEIASIPAVMDTSAFTPEDHRAYKKQMSKYAKTHKALFVTCTYESGVEWNNKQLTRCLHAVREWHARKGIPFRYVWVAEIQEHRKRHSPEAHGVHYHLVIWLPKKYILPNFDTRGWWPHGSSNCKKAYSPIGYLLKYASKGCTGEFTFPKGCRKHGCGGLTKDHRRLKTWHFRPAYVKEHFPNYQDNVQPAKGGGWISKRTGEWLDSAWDLVSIFPLVIRPKNPLDTGKRTKSLLSFIYSAASIRVTHNFILFADKGFIPL